MNSRLAQFGSSVFAEMTALARAHHAVNLGQGFPDFDTPAEVKEIAMRAIADGHNQYAVSHGEPVLRAALAEHAERFYNQPLNPDENICVTSGASEALWCAIQACINPGDEVIVFEPSFDVYIPNIVMAGGVVVPVTLHAPSFRFNREELRAAFSKRTRLLILNTPHNPTGTVFTRDEIEFIRDLCAEYGALVISDEVYEHIVFAPNAHIRPATIEGMGERTITISSGGKTFSCTGWKCGWALGTKPLIDAVRRVHQFTVFAGATPFHYAIAHALRLTDSFYMQLLSDYTRRKDMLLAALRQTPLHIHEPEGAYFITADISPLTTDDGITFSKRMITEIGVATIPSQKFYVNEEHGRSLIRFCFCKKDETLNKAAERMLSLSSL
ncbi:MAG: aminotransferase class I/II-fold pyridoxal phosphate-dependent enzyme [Candidatus Kapabacteria bacterium]|nr:aminotransferase class I/II-fold pyridoxal phosphate-dependent enzyme [Candidatus Kapabacteria bacterium]